MSLIEMSPNLPFEALKELGVIVTKLQYISVTSNTKKH